MMSAFQGSLLDQSDEVGPGPLGSSVRRTGLARGAWIDLRPGWVSGADRLLGRLAAAVPWRAERRRMYDRVVDVPRLVCFYREGAALPDPALDDLRNALNAHYEAELGEPFVTAGLCYYRDGRDSVAWHGDTTGRGARGDTMVAIVSIGAPRALLLRPRGGGPAIRHDLGHGDLLVMGGSCQRTWEHAIPLIRGPPARGSAYSSGRAGFADCLSPALDPIARHGQPGLPAGAGSHGPRLPARGPAPSPRVAPYGFLRPAGRGE